MLVRQRVSSSMVGSERGPKALIVIDMQCGLLEGDPRPANVEEVVCAINAVAVAVRQSGGQVFFVQHHGAPGDRFAPGSAEWQLLPQLEVERKDILVPKTICDAFYKSTLDESLKDLGIKQLLVGGWATDFCVDTTIRAAASLAYEVTVIKDGHTLADRPHLPADLVLTHHNQTWPQMIVPSAPIQVLSAESICQRLRGSKGGVS